MKGKRPLLTVYTERPCRADALVVDEMRDAGVAKRQRRSAEEKRRIVENHDGVGSFAIARVAREHGVSANQVCPWRGDFQMGSTLKRFTRNAMTSCSLRSSFKASMFDLLTVAVMRTGSGTR